MKKQVKNLTINEIEKRGITTYYKAVLFDNIGFGVNDIVGRFKTLEEAKKECRRWDIEKLEDEGLYKIGKYELKEKGKYTMSEFVYYHKGLKI